MVLLGQTRLHQSRNTPDSPLMVVVEVMAVARARVREASGVAVLVADRILVDRGVGLGCAVVGRGDAVTGFTAVVAVSVVHSTIWVFIYRGAHTFIARKKNFTICCSWKKKFRIIYHENNETVMWYRDKRL